MPASALTSRPSRRTLRGSARPGGRSAHARARTSTAAASPSIACAHVRSSIRRARASPAASRSTCPAGTASGGSCSRSRVTRAVHCSASSPRASATSHAVLEPRTHTDRSPPPSRALAPATLVSAAPQSHLSGGSQSSRRAIEPTGGNTGIGLPGLRAHHHPHPVLTAGDRRRAVGDRADSYRATLVFTRRRSRGCRRTSRSAGHPQAPKAIPAAENA